MLVVDFVMKQHKNHHYCKRCGRRCGSFVYCDIHNPNKSISEKEILDLDCPRCYKGKSVYIGNYRIQRTNTAQKRFKCLNCKIIFKERTDSFRKIVPMWKRQQIIRLYNKEKGYIKKYDPFKKSTYSTRDIAKRLEVSSSFVASFIKTSLQRIEIET